MLSRIRPLLGLVGALKGWRPQGPLCWVFTFSGLSMPPSVCFWSLDESINFWAPFYAENIHIRQRTSSPSPGTRGEEVSAVRTFLQLSWSLDSEQKLLCHGLGRAKIGVHRSWIGRRCSVKGGRITSQPPCASTEGILERLRSMLHAHGQRAELKLGDFQKKEKWFHGISGSGLLPIHCTFSGWHCEVLGCSRPLSSCLPRSQTPRIEFGASTFKHN